MSSSFKLHTGKLNKRKNKQKKKKKEREKQEHMQLHCLWHVKKCRQKWLTDRPCLRAVYNLYQRLSCPYCAPSQQLVHNEFGLLSMHTCLYLLMKIKPKILCSFSYVFLI